METASRAVSAHWVILTPPTRHTHARGSRLIGGLGEERLEVAGLHLSGLFRRWIADDGFALSLLPLRVHSSAQKP